ncbi:MAG: A/G-specific adenine glycosylase [Myxococcales bacterium]|jgi:A/G-specific adenine glycosylase|nr:A/G-specific adenine glycosylase [Myxococcales bacterium]
MKRSRPLLAWYDRVRRDLPWRRVRSPYRTLVSEFMLQQTVVATVVPYFERFVARFPDVRALAAEREDDVLALWSGLGYYARARNLHRAAIAVVAQHGGEIPSDEATLATLPGVGAYTAAAVAAIAFDARTFALDGNGARVMARLHGVRDVVDGPAVRLRLRALGLADVPLRRAGDFNQAVMELGALVCSATGPACDDCPLRGDCAARAQGLTDVIPARRGKAPRPAVRVACAYVTRAGRVLLVRRAEGQLLASTWALPSAPIDGKADGRAAARQAVIESGVIPSSGQPQLRGEVRHIFTHRDLTADVYAVAVGETAGGAAARATKAAQASQASSVRWVATNELATLGISSFTRKTLAAAEGLVPRQKRDSGRDQT